MPKPHPPPRATPARGGGNPAGEELHGTGANKRTATVRSHSETGRTSTSTRHDTADTDTHVYTPQAQATGRVIVTTGRTHARAELAGDVASHRRRVAAAGPSRAHGATEQCCSLLHTPLPPYSTI